MFIFTVISYMSMMMLSTNNTIEPPVRSYYGDFLFERGASDLGFIGGEGPYVSFPDDIEQGIECRPTINTARKMAVQIESPRLDPWYKNNISNPEWNKDVSNGKNWVLVKENAPIPAWKVWAGGGRCDEGSGIRVCGEMEHIGQTVAATTDPTGGSNNPDVASGSDVYIGVGWCNPEDIEVPEPRYSGRTSSYLRENGCLDPLTQDVLFVVTREGAKKDEPRPGFITDHSWGRNEEEKPEKTRETLEQYYWTFNVYINEEKLPANPTYEDLPAWMKLQCPDGSDVWGGPRCEADPLCSCYLRSGGEGCENLLPQAALESALANGPPPDDLYQDVLASSQTFTTADGNPRLVIRNDELDGIDRAIAADNGIVLEQNYISLGEVPGIDPEKDIPLGTAYLNHFNVWMRLDLQPNISTADHALILVPIGKEGPNFIFGPILQVVNPEEHNLQLGTFVPGLPLLNLELPTSLAYEWWTPSCKPALYLYPEQETDVSVSVHPEGLITHSIPHHGTHGWNVTAYPDGTIVNLDPSSDRDDPAIGNLISAPSTYSYLYYEAAIDKLEVPKDTGWIKTTDELLVFFTSVLPTLGLNEVESADFIEYWMPKLTEEGETTWYITLIEDEELERVEPLTISPVPDTSIRVRFYFENLAEVQDEEKQARTIVSAHTNQSLTSPQLPTTIYQTQRDGFTLVDWGGILGNGSCGVDEVSQ